MTVQRSHVVFLGEVGFPVGFGAIQRQLLIAKGMIECGDQVTVISFKGNHPASQDFPPSGTYQGVDYHYSSGSIHKPSGFLKRNLAKLSGRLKELQYISRLKRSGDLKAAYISTDKFHRILIYWIWLKWLGVPWVLNYDEFMSAIPPKSNMQRWNDRLFDRYAVQLAAGVTPISEYIREKTLDISPAKPIFKLPILCDFDKFDPTPVEKDEISFTYCGAASYLELIDFVLEAFDQLEIGDRPVYLDFILGGNTGALAVIKERMEKRKNSNRIRLQANVPHTQIPDRYAQATALLIPMRPTVQDAARFPHKIGEYLASGRAVITTNFGEIQHYGFVDGQTALVAADYEVAAFSEKMNFVMEHPKRACAIGQEGRKMGLQNFNYKDLGCGLRQFILNLLQ